MAAEHRPEPPDVDSRYMSVAQVARRLGCSVSLVQKWRRLGWIDATRLGPPEVPVYGYLPEDVDRFVHERWNRRRGRPPGSTNATTQPAGTPPPPHRSPFSAPLLGPSTTPTLRPRRTEPSTPRTTPHVTRPSSAPAPPTPPSTIAASQPPIFAPAPYTAAPQPPVSAQAPRAAAPAPRAAAPTGRPLVLWDADPSTGRPLVLARFSAAELDDALHVAATWAPRYPTLILGELPIPGQPPLILARWENGTRQPAP